MYEREKRKRELSEIIESFKEKMRLNGYDAEIPLGVEDKILTIYEDLLFRGLKHIHVDGTNINIYKIASSTELIINYLQIIKTNSPTLSVFLNAQLASDVAFSLVISKNFDDIGFKLSELEEGLLSNHLEWLMYSTPSDFLDFSILGNSLFWKSFYTCVSQRIGNN